MLEGHSNWHAHLGIERTVDFPAGCRVTLWSNLPQASRRQQRLLLARGAITVIVLFAFSVALLSAQNLPPDAPSGTLGGQQDQPGSASASSLHSEQENEADWHSLADLSAGDYPNHTVGAAAQTFTPTEPSQRQLYWKLLPANVLHEPLGPWQALGTNSGLGLGHCGTGGFGPV